MTSPLQLDRIITTQLACPVCKGDLRLEASRLICRSCSRSYPILDGIPVLIPDRATTT